MIAPEVLEAMQCTACQGPELVLGSGRRPELLCTSCGTHFPVVQGIPDMITSEAPALPGSYRTETLFNVIAGVYDVVAPVMSLAIWRCSPLRYIDLENRALGRANGGLYLAAPIGTGVALAPVLAGYQNVTVIGVDRSWKMLERAQRRFAEARVHVQLIRADYRQLPIKSASVRSIQSLNGLHMFEDRAAALREFGRCLEPGGNLSGTALVRTQEDVAAVFLDRYERYGIYPLLRSPEFLLQEMRHTGLGPIHFETHGAVMFFAGSASAPTEDAQSAVVRPVATAS